MMISTRRIALFVALALAGISVAEAQAAAPAAGAGVQVNNGAPGSAPAPGYGAQSQPSAPSQPAQTQAAPVQDLRGTPPSSGAVPQQPSAAPNAVPTAGVPLPSPLVKAPDLVEMSVQQLAPMGLDQIKTVRRTLGDREKALYEPLDVVPKLISQVLHLDLSPNGKKAEVHLAMNMGGTVSFIDIAGNPWPIEHVDNFASKGYTVSLPAENTLSIWSIEPYITGNVAVVLKGLSSPVSFIVEPARDEANDRTDLIVPRILPGKQEGYLAGGGHGGIAAYNDELTPYLLRTPPRDAKPLRVMGADDTEAWQTGGGSLIVRTRDDLRAPAYVDTGSAADGTHVYKLEITPVITVATDGGSLSYVQITGYDTRSRGSSGSSEGGDTK
jgi:intracellular multiplication protein IcmK